MPNPRSQIIKELHRTDHSAYRYTVIDLLENRIVIITSDEKLARHIAHSLDTHTGTSTLNILNSD